MAKPDYVTIASQLAIETDPVERQNLKDQLYVFSVPQPLPEGETIEDYLLTDAEKQVFAYVYDDYIENNPGLDEANTFVSYVGVYYGESGETT